MTSVAVGLQVWDITQSSLMVGLVGLFQLVPLVGFGLYGGTLSDAFDRRKVGVVSAAGLWVCSMAFLAQSLLQWNEVSVLYLVVAVQSAFFAVGNPARQSIIPRIVPAELLPAANALGMITWNVGFTLGPVLGGLLVAFTGHGHVRLRRGRRGVRRRAVGDAPAAEPAADRRARAPSARGPAGPRSRRASSSSRASATCR